MKVKASIPVLVWADHAARSMHRTAHSDPAPML